MRSVVCSLCKRPLEPIGSVLDEARQRGTQVMGGDAGGFEQWMGTVCTKCRLVFCPSCKQVGPGPCPRCGENTKPAMASFLPTSSAGCVLAGLTLPAILLHRLLR